MEKEPEKKALPIFNPAVPSIICVIVAASIGIFTAHFEQIFNM